MRGSAGMENINSEGFQGRKDKKSGFGNNFTERPYSEPQIKKEYELQKKKIRLF